MERCILEDDQRDQDLCEHLSHLSFCEEDEEEEEVQCDDDESDDADFSFVCNDGALLSPIAAEDLFLNGEIRPAFPFFNRDHRFETPPVKQIFVETKCEPPMASSSSSSGNAEITGPCCQWSSEKKMIAEKRPADEVCKKSNSTGFSKFLRFKDFIHRSNSDGKDAFVFLNPPAPSRKVEEKKLMENKNNTGEVKVKVKVPKKKTESALAHERYMRSKANDGGGRRRSYLPYRPELVGLFTNVNGGLTRNVHPF